MRGKQKRFANEYIISRNGADAVRKAGYSTKYPEKRAFRLLKRVDISGYIRDRDREIEEQSNINRDKYLKMTLKQWQDAIEGTNKTRLWEILGKAGGNLTGDNVNVKITTINPNISQAELTQALTDELNKRHTKGS